MEAVGALLLGFGVHDGDWTLVVTVEEMGLLQASMLTRGPFSINMVVGFSDMRQTGPALETIRSRVDDYIVPSIIEADKLPPLHWAQPAT